MARRSILTVQERQSLLALPDNQSEFIRHYSLSESDLSLIQQKRGDANRLGFAIQLCYMQYPGIVLADNQTPDRELLKFIATQLNCHPSAWETYGLREVTKREHALELQRLFGFSAFARQDYQQYVDYVFALMHLLGFKFAPRIRNFKEMKLFAPTTASENNYPLLKPMLGGTINTQRIEENWTDILRLATSIKQGTATASLLVKKLSSYPRQNSLAGALREIGRIERTLFALEWLQDVELRRRVQAGLNKGEARNALARAVFFNRLGEIRDQSFEQQQYRASGLNLITAAIVLWNTVYIERAVNALRVSGYEFDDDHLQYLSPLGWEHINLTGDYIWKTETGLGKGMFRPLMNMDDF